MDTIRVGRISALNYAAGTARIVYADRDSAVTAELPLLASEYHMPQVDDLVLVLHLPNGPEAGIVLGRYWCKQNAPPESGPGLYRKDLDRSGAAYIRYDAATGILTLKSPGGIRLESNTAVAGSVAADGTLSASGGVTLGGGNATVPGNLNVTGNVTAAGDVTGAGISLSTHKHTSTTAGSDTSTPH